MGLDIMVATSWWRLLIGNPLLMILARRSGESRHFLVAAIDWKPSNVEVGLVCNEAVATSWWRLLIGN